MNTSVVEAIHQDLAAHLQTGRALIFVQTPDEEYLEVQLKLMAASMNAELWTWQINDGLIPNQGQPTQDPIDTLRLLQQSEQRPLVWMKDLHLHYSAQVIRALRDLYFQWRQSGGMIVLSGPNVAIPDEIQRETALVQLEMPSLSVLQSVVNQYLEDHDLGHLPERVLAATLKGLTLSEARHALARIGAHTSEHQALSYLAEEKRQLIQKVGTLEYIPEVPTMDELGGLENLKEWLIARKELLLSDDDETRAIAPKGMLLMGVSGCGKSLCIKAVSSAWQLPLYRMEMVNVFSGANGPPEQAFAKACKTMESMAPAVLWIDEIEMGLSAEGSSQSDSALSRIFAYFLTWMQEKPAGLFVAATANRIDLLPAEMIRKGRFDQVFFVDLPRMQERKEIFRIHLANRGFDPTLYDLEVFADSTKGWNGAEIEQCVVSAITSARLQQRQLELKDLYLARKQIVPISTTMEEQVRHIRNWAYERAVPASKTEEL